MNAVRGSDFVDTVTAAGARGFFQFIGLKGNDTFTGTTEAINNFDFNMARYDVVSNSAGTINNGVNVVLDTTSTVTDIAGGNAVGTDTLINIDRIRGSSQTDTFIANAGYSGRVRYAELLRGHGRQRYHHRQRPYLCPVHPGPRGRDGQISRPAAAQSTAGGDAAGIGIDTFIGGVNSCSARPSTTR